jgi:hypothetical protein
MGTGRENDDRRVGKERQWDGLEQKRQWAEGDRNDDVVEAGNQAGISQVSVKWYSI